MQLITQITGKDGNLMTGNPVDFTITPVEPTIDCASFTDGQILRCNIPNTLYGNPTQYLIKGQPYTNNPRILYFNSETNAWDPTSTSTLKAVASTQGIKTVVTTSTLSDKCCDIYVAFNDLEFNLIPADTTKAKIVTYVDTDINYGNFNNYRRWKYSTDADSEACIILGCLAITTYPQSDNIVYFLVAKRDSSDTTHVQVTVTWWTQKKAAEFGNSQLLATSRLQLISAGNPTNPSIDERVTHLEDQVNDIQTSLDLDLGSINAQLEIIRKSLSQVSGVFVSR